MSPHSSRCKLKVTCHRCRLKKVWKKFKKNLGKACHLNPSYPVQMPLGRRGRARVWPALFSCLLLPALGRFQPGMTSSPQPRGALIKYCSLPHQHKWKMDFVRSEFHDFPDLEKKARSIFFTLSNRTLFFLPGLWTWNTCHQFDSGHTMIPPHNSDCSIFFVRLRHQLIWPKKFQTFSALISTSGFVKKNYGFYFHKCGRREKDWINWVGMHIRL